MKCISKFINRETLDDISSDWDSIYDTHLLAYLSKYDKNSICGESRPEYHYSLDSHYDNIIYSIDDHSEGNNTLLLIRKISSESLFIDVDTLRINDLSFELLNSDYKFNFDLFQIFYNDDLKEDDCNDTIELLYN